MNKEVSMFPTLVFDSYKEFPWTAREGSRQADVIT